jgi:hypothetical protein
MPLAGQLPQDLRELADRDAVELSQACWSFDVHLLINALRSQVDPTDS